MITPFADLLKVNKTIRKNNKSTSLTFALDTIDTFLQRAIDFNLGYLFFNRSIPTLSGGELQRLRMVQVFNTQLTDLLIVLDEPLGGLSGKEKKKIYDIFHTDHYDKRDLNFNEIIMFIRNIKKDFRLFHTFLNTSI